MLKKILLVATMATMTLSLCACDKEKSKTTTEIEVPEFDYDEISSNFNEVNNAATEEIETIDAERGVIENGAYTNKLFDISFPIKDTYYVYDDETIAQLIGLSADMMDENGVISAEQYEAAAAGCIYDVMFAFEDQQSNVSIIYQNIGSMPNGNQLTAQSYAEMTKYQLENMTSPAYTVSDVTTASYGGYEYAILDSDTDQGFGQMQLIRMHGNYIIAITITYMDGSKNLCTEFLSSLSNAQ